MKKTSIDLTAYTKAKPIHLPFLDTIILTGAKLCIEIGLLMIVMVLLSKYLSRRFENLSTNDEVQKNLLIIGIGALILGTFLFIFFKFF